MKRLLILLGLAASAAPALLAAAPTPPPPPVLTQTTASPTPSATPTAMPGVNGLFPARPHASPSPPVPQRVGISGVWEIALQQGPTTTYVHLNLRQQSNVLTGTYLDSSNKPSPAVGTVDGDNVRIVVTQKDGSTIVFDARLDGTTDMIGLMTTPTASVAFTGDYRAKENFFDNINENPTGLSNPLTTPPPK